MARFYQVYQQDFLGIALEQGCAGQSDHPPTASSTPHAGSNDCMPMDAGIRRFDKQPTQEIALLFMLKIDVSLPADMADAEKTSLRQRENARAEELIAQGTMQRIWRIVGRVANFSVWEAPSLEALHEEVTSMPMFPYMKIDVTPLIAHPVTHVAESRNGSARKS